MFKKRVLSRIYESWSDEVTGGCRKWRNEGLHDSCTIRQIVRGWPNDERRDVAHMREDKFAHKVLAGKPDRQSRLQDLGLDRMIIYRTMREGVDWRSCVPWRYFTQTFDITAICPQKWWCRQVPSLGYECDRTVSYCSELLTWDQTFLGSSRCLFYPFKRRIKSHLPFAGIIRSSPYSLR